MNPHRARRSVVFDPPFEQWPARGVYQLRLRVSVDVRLTVGRLGRFTFPAGLYVYTGRAARGLGARVRRHVSGRRRRQWHIDYLLARREVRIEQVVLASRDPADECAVNQAIGAAGVCVAPGFGSSDCRARCPSHLWRIGLRQAGNRSERVRQTAPLTRREE